MLFSKCFFLTSKSKIDTLNPLSKVMWNTGRDFITNVHSEMLRETVLRGSSKEE